MSAVEVLQLAQDHGVRLSVVGADLALLAEQAPPPAVLDAIRREKPAIVRALAKPALKGAQLAEIAAATVGTPETDLMALLDDDDRAELVAERLDLATLTAFARAVRDRRLREQGKRPPGWDHLAHCARCGPIWYYESPEVDNCVWCFNRVQRRPIPRPDAARDAALEHAPSQPAQPRDPAESQP